MSADTFKDKLKIKILESLANNYSDNWPGEQLGPEKYVEKKFMGFSPSFPTLKKTFIDLNSGYKFYVDHHTIHENETVLFAIPDTA